MTYATTRARRPSDGAVQINSRTNSWQAASSPMLEVVLLELRTEKGECLADPDMGVEWKKVRKNSISAPATAKALIEAALRRHVTAGRIVTKSVVVEVNAARGTLAYEVTFTDVRLNSTQTATGTR